VGCPFQHDPALLSPQFPLQGVGTSDEEPSKHCFVLPHHQQLAVVQASHPVSELQFAMQVRSVIPSGCIGDSILVTTETYLQDNNCNLMFCNMLNTN
jgi:hypothetical protein